MVALRRQRRMGAAVERLAAQERRPLAGDPQRHQHLAVERAVPHRVVAVIGQPDRVVRRDMDAMRPAEHAFAPGAQEIAGFVEDRDRVVAAVEGVDIVMAVDADRGAIAEHDVVRDLRPILLDLEAPLAAAEPFRHGFPPAIARRRVVGARFEGAIDAILNRLAEPSKTGRETRARRIYGAIVSRAGEQGAEGAMPRWLSGLCRGAVAIMAMLAGIAGAQAEGDLAAVARDAYIYTFPLY